MASKNKNPLKKFQKGAWGIVTELVTSFVFGFLITLFAGDKLISPDVVAIFTLIGFAGSIILMFSFQKRGFVFLFGWIVAACLLRSMFSPFDFVVYVAAPIAAVAFKTYWMFVKVSRRVRVR